VGVLFSLETISFDAQKLLSFMWSHLSMLSLSCCAAGEKQRSEQSLKMRKKRKRGHWRSNKVEAHGAFKDK
jgi:hypothetical protein